MRHARHSKSEVDVTVGYAAAGDGAGVAYARLAGAAGEHLLRVPFEVRWSKHDEREAGYAALTAVAVRMRRAGVQRVRFALGDGNLLAEIAGHREPADCCVLPYVRLRCALNQLGSFRLELSTDEDLAQRARAEVALHTAA
jgi:uncharacterized membrane protein